MKKNKIVFLDRDGVINKDPHEKKYVMAWKDFCFLPNAKKALKRLNEAGYKVVVISNQAGIAKGFYTYSKLRYITKKMLDEIKKSGGRIAKVYYCIHRDEDSCSCRKPKAGLFRKARKELDLNSNGAYFIGDSETDIKAGRCARLKTILVLSGKMKPRDLKNLKAKPDLIKKDLYEAVKSLTEG